MRLLFTSRNFDIAPLQFKLIYFLYTIGLITILILTSTNSFGQLDNPDWDSNNAACVSDALLYPGVAVITCGVVQAQAADQRYTVAYVGMNEGPGTNRSEITNADSTLHHDDWLVSSIGNVFGTAIIQSTAEVFVTASSNYSSSFGVLSPSNAILNYGSIANPSNSTEAAGRVYRIDPITGDVTVFATLPQQTTTFTHWDCERDRQANTRTTGVGLGNIVYDELNDQFFVSNTEDGRIYRLDATGNILDSYDPGTLDNNAAGITDLEDIPYGLAIEPGSGRLFYGIVDIGTFSNNFAVAGAPSIYSIDLNSNGGWASTTTNNTSPSSYSWDNYVGSEQFHTTIAVGGGNSYTNWTTYFISDLAFDPSGNLLAGVRVGCFGSWHSSYNHWAETNKITLNTTSNLYDNAPSEFDISVTGDAGNDDSYGGVAVYDKKDASCDIWYLASSADILAEVGPHGIAVWDSETTINPISPLGSFSYGVLASGDPKGIGGDVEVYNGCSTCDIAGPTTVCSGASLTYSFTPTCPDNSIEWTVSGDATIQGANNQNSVTINAGSNNFTVSLSGNSVDNSCTVSVVVNTPTADAGTDVEICTGNSTSLSASGGTSYSWSPSAGLSATNISNPTANPTATTTYTVTVTDGNGCTATDNVLVTVHALPTAAVIAISATCPVSGTEVNIDGSIKLLNFPAGATYQYSEGVIFDSGTGMPAVPASIPVDSLLVNNLNNPTSPKDYTIRVYDNNNCYTDVTVTLQPTTCFDYPDYTDTCPAAPCHAVSEDIYLGTGVSIDGSPNSNSNASTDIDDGLNLFPSLTIVPGGSFNLPVNMYNATGSDAYLNVWIDWNGDGDFNDTDELVTTATYPTATQAGTYSDIIEVIVPVSATQNQPIAMRWRYTTDGSLNGNSPCGTGTCAIDGEVEDYIINVQCKSNICLPTIVNVVKN